MVKALHRAGIEVILDVVYNHTAEGSELGPTLSFRGIDNATYYRLVPEQERYYMDYTGTGNTPNMRHPQVLKLIMDSLRYWVQEMHVDGFRFDLAAALARGFYEVDHLSGFFDVIHQDPVLTTVKLIAEPWDVGEGGYQVGNFPVLWAEWNGKYRDGVRRYWRGDDSQTAELASRLTGSSDLYQEDGRRPHASINFITAHDGFTLHDLVSYDGKHNEANGEGNHDGANDNNSWNCGAEGPTDDPGILALRQRQMRNLLATLFLSQGVPMLLGGDEFGRTQQGNNNAYCQDNEISWYDWNLADWQRDLLDFTRRVIELRRQHPSLHRRKFFQGRRIRGADVEDIAWLRADGAEMTDEEWETGWVRTLGVRLGSAIGEVDEEGRPVTDDTLLLLFSASADPMPFVMPAPEVGRWEVVLDTHDEQSKDGEFGGVCRGPAVSARGASGGGVASCQVSCVPHTGCSYMPGSASMPPPNRRLSCRAGRESPLLLALPAGGAGEHARLRRRGPPPGERGARRRGGARAACEALGQRWPGADPRHRPQPHGIASRENAWWWDVLENGPASRYAATSTSTGSRPRRSCAITVLMPVLGDHYGRVLEAGELKLERDGGAFTISYHDHRCRSPRDRSNDLLAAAARPAVSDELAFLADAFGQPARCPTATDRESIAPPPPRQGSPPPRCWHALCWEHREVAQAIDAEVAEINADPTALDALLERQNYRLAYWRAAGRELDYRRFFDINTLVGLRIEDERVFAGHARAGARLGARGRCSTACASTTSTACAIPEQYLERLHAGAPGRLDRRREDPRRGESSCPTDWPVAGTTGYDFLNRVTGLFDRPRGRAAADRLLRRLHRRSPPTDYRQMVRDKKHLVLRGVVRQRPAPPDARSGERLRATAALSRLHAPRAARACSGRSSPASPSTAPTSRAEAGRISRRGYAVHRRGDRGGQARPARDRRATSSTSSATCFRSA